MTVPPTKRLLLIGAAGIDWPSLKAVMAHGLAPNLTRLAEAGGLGPLRGSEPGIAGWASLVTGVEPEGHGIWGSHEAWAGGLRPVGSASWGVPPLWARLEASGVATAGLAWPGARDGADWAGTHVDETFGVATGPDWNDWALPLRCAPAALREGLRGLRVHPADISGAQLLPLVPALASIDQERESGLALLAVAMAQAATVQAAAVHLLGQPDWQAMFVHHRWLDDVRARSLSTPPWDHLVDGAWRFLDGMIGHLAAVAGADCTVLVVSPGSRGVAGVVLAAGPGVSVTESAAIIDIAPTILAAFGLRDEALAGRALTTGTAALRPVSPFPRPEAVDSRPALERMAALGYAPPPPPPLKWQVERLLRIATALVPRNPAQAGEAAAAALRLMPENLDALSLRAAAHVALNEAEALPPLAEQLVLLAPERPWGALVHGAHFAMKDDAAAARPWLLAAEAGGEPDTTMRVGAAWLLLKRMADAERAFDAVLAAQPGKAEAAVGLSVAALARNQLHRAEAPLRAALDLDPGCVPVLLQLADVLSRGGRTIEAAEARRSAERLGASA